ncbi:glycosyltransferase [Methylobacterium gossipiicola]|uniref:Glycosyltransferase involved in cell wall bisynthesis n=1 Tax=Methylobacterium gossipiicola TaxID=582675 RepID=A0A1I2RC92_9HYPH|nr:glycosyltransferase [Methylobacterium gossipiicola]SFG36217.1 Glycosyltransferase involved in cell wall bisynthesis [Methylobacterium gossipiicola]
MLEHDGHGIPDGRDRAADHGIAHWPFDSPALDVLPPTLPDGRAWPSIHILTPSLSDAPGFLATAASITGQTYPSVQHHAVPPDPEGAARVEALLADDSADYLLVLRSGDLLAPGALAALALEAVLTDAEVVAGLRVVFGAAVLGLDAVAQAPGHLDAAVPAGHLGAFTGGECLLSRAMVRRAGGLDLPCGSPVADLWPRLAGSRFARIGRPVLLQYEPELDPSPPSPGLAIATLTDHGAGGGAGIAHRRLAAALVLAGHRVAEHRLAGEAVPAGAEWQDSFPRTEAAIRDGGYDLLLVGNIHGATRRLALLDRLRRHLPVAVVMHDFFPITGRCAFPNGCTRLVTGCDAQCPTPTQYPHLAPARIAGVHAEKRALLTAPDAPLLLANSSWTHDYTRGNAPAGTAVARIDLAFPTGVFRPGDRAALRRQLGLPAGDVLVMFGAVIADAPGKGFQDLMRTLRRIARPGLGFVAVGRLDDSTSLGLPNLFVAGPVAEEAVLAQWYGACDIYVTASLNETLGQTPVEAGLCGIPTVAYRASGLTSAVIDGVSGVLVPQEPDALGDALLTLVADEPLRKRLGGLGRIALGNRFSDAAAALTFNDRLVARGLLAPPPGGRQRFSPRLLGRFAYARDRYPGETGTVSGPSSTPIRLLRRAKRAVLGRDLPLWARRGLYAGGLLIRAVRRFR